MQEEAPVTDSNLSLAISVERKTVKIFPQYITWALNYPRNSGQVQGQIWRSNIKVKFHLKLTFTFDHQILPWTWPLFRGFFKAQVISYLFQSKKSRIFTFAFHIFQCMNLVFGILMLVTILIVITGGLWLLFFSSKPQTAMEMIIGNKRGLIVNNTGLDPLAQPFKGWFNWLHRFRWRIWSTKTPMTPISLASTKLFSKPVNSISFILW